MPQPVSVGSLLQVVTLSSPVLQPAQAYDVLICSAESPGCFYLQLLMHLSDMHQLNAELAGFQPIASPATLRQSQLLISHTSAGGEQWYRVEVQRIESQDQATSKEFFYDKYFYFICICICYFYSYNLEIFHLLLIFGRDQIR